MVKLKSLQKNYGTALITVMLIVAIVSIAAITMQGYLRVEINRTQMIVDGDELYNNLLSLEAWGLYKIKTTESKGLDSLSVTRKKDTVSLTGKIINQNGFYNINYLNNTNFCRNIESSLRQKILAKIFTNLVLLTQTTEPVSSEQLAKIINNIYEWQCARSSNDAQFLPITDSKWQYQKSGQMFMDVSELRLVPGVTDSMYFKIKDKITALPVRNINSVNFDLNALSPELYAAITFTDVVTAKQALENLKTQSDAEKLNSIINIATNASKYSLTEEIPELRNILSNNEEREKFYVIEGKASKSESRMGLQSLVLANNNDIRVIWRKRVI